MAKSKIVIERPSLNKDALRASIKRLQDANRKRIARQKAAPKGTTAGDFWGWLDDADIGNPFDDLEATGDLETDDATAVGAMSEALQRIVREKRDRREKYNLLVDASYYLVLCFQTTEQKEAFIRAKGWDVIQGNFQWVYMNGLEVADLEGIELEPIYLPTKEPPQAPRGLRGHPVIETTETKEVI